MPRDLSAMKEETLQEMPEITKSPEQTEDAAASEPNLFSDMASANSKRDELHCYTQSLTISDLESCLRLEEATFPPEERGTREKFQYRLKTCGDLSMGIFTSHEDSTIATASTSAPVYSGAPKRKAVLLGHILSTKSTNTSVKDADMDVPDSNSSASEVPIGHSVEGRTVCVHSLAVLPAYQRRGLGKTLMKAYLQRMESAGVADRVALLAHKDMVPFYESLGFVETGTSEVKFAGGGWSDMVHDLKMEQESTLADLM